MPGFTIKLAATSVSAASLFVSKCVSLSERDRAVAHATRSAEGSQSCREDADDDLNDGLPSFLLHSAFMLFLGVDYYGGSPAGAKPPPIA